MNKLQHAAVKTIGEIQIHADTVFNSLLTYEGTEDQYTTLMTYLWEIEGKLGGIARALEHSNKKRNDLVKDSTNVYKS